MFDDAIHFLVDEQKRAPGPALAYEWLVQDVQYTRKATFRQRRLPVVKVDWRVIAFALYRHQSISEVVDDLDLALPGLQTPFLR